MSYYVYTPSSASHRSHKGRRLWSDNIMLIPASQLPFKSEWMKIAQDLPAREVFMVVPAADTPLKRVARALMPQLRAHGRHVTTIPAHT